jgi:hypothetical protein
VLSHLKSGTETADAGEVMTGIPIFVAEVRVQDLAKEIRTQPRGERMGKAARVAHSGWQSEGIPGCRI